jgi:hypothetical protein
MDLRESVIETLNDPNQIDNRIITAAPLGSVVQGINQGDCGGAQPQTQEQNQGFSLPFVLKFSCNLHGAVRQRACDSQIA